MKLIEQCKQCINYKDEICAVVLPQWAYFITGKLGYTLDKWNASIKYALENLEDNLGCEFFVNGENRVNDR